MTDPIDADTWRLALEAALTSAPTDGLSTQEISALCDIHSRNVRYGLKRLASQNRLTVQKRYQQGIDGIRRPIPVYRLKPPPEPPLTTTPPASSPDTPHTTATSPHPRSQAPTPPTPPPSSSGATPNTTPLATR